MAKPLAENIELCEQYFLGGAFPFALYFGKPVSCVWSGGPGMYRVFDAPEPSAGVKSFCQDYSVHDPFPLAHYYNSTNSTISVRYRIEREIVDAHDEGRFSRILIGTATIYERPRCAGMPIDQEDFESRELWSDPHSPYFWPANWWAPHVQKLVFKLQIKTMGEFNVEKRGNQWEWDTRLYKKPRTQYKDKWKVKWDP